MKICVFLLATMAVMCTATSIRELIQKEVRALLQADSNLTAAQCISKCDALFDLVAVHDETFTDRWCKHECECQKTGTCHQHPTQPTRHPHTSAAPAP